MKNEWRAAAERALPAVFAKQVLAWLRMDSTLAERDAAWSKLDERALVLAGRARSSVSFAEFAQTPQEPALANAEALACELYRQGAYWALCALAHVNGGATAGDWNAIWKLLTDARLSKVLASSAEFESFRAALQSGSFVYFAELEQEERAPMTAMLRRLSSTLLLELGERYSVLHFIRMRRRVRLGLLTAALGCVLSLPVLAWKHWQTSGDLSAGRAWRVSSEYGGFGCVSPEQECPEHEGAFFHTQVNDPNPWIEFDLGSSKQVSRVVVENRSDCCIDRAVPLVIELSGDQQKYRVVAERREEFWTWQGSFPSQTARWVRIRIPRPGTLHLARVRIER